MRRRITIAMILMVVGALVLAGVVSLVLSVHQVREQTRKELVGEAQSLAAAVRQEAANVNHADPARSLHTMLVELKRPLRLQGEAVLAVRENGTLFDPANPGQAPVLPSGLHRADLDTSALLAGQTTSGVRGSLVYAAVPYRAEVQIAGAPRSVQLAVVLTRRPPTGLSSVGPWFLLAAVVIIAAAAVVANRLGHRFVRPLEAAENVTRQIASGDLEARVPEPRGTDPELAALTASINDMASSLAQARGSERQFLLSVSHDLRTPLTSIRGFAEAIEDGATEDAPRAATVIASEAQRLERLVGDLLALAQLEARQFSLDMRPTDLGETAAAAADGFSPAAAELGLQVTTWRDSRQVMARADPDRLAQVAANLVENALKYARNTVLVGATVSAGYPVLWVDDDGPGVAPKDLTRVFERLYASRERPGRRVGTGLGLAIVAELVTAMGGTVRAESPLGADGGTRMVVTLPVSAPAPSPPPHTNGSPQPD